MQYAETSAHVYISVAHKERTIYKYDIIICVTTPLQKLKTHTLYIMTATCPVIALFYVAKKFQTIMHEA